MPNLIHPARKMRALAHLTAFALLAAAALTAPAVHAQDWPAKPVRIVVPFSAGGTTDISARLVAEHLSKAFKQNFVVENKPGAGGNIGAAEVANAAPDGYAILMNTPGPAAINQFLFRQMPFEQDALVSVSYRQHARGHGPDQGGQGDSPGGHLQRQVQHPAGRAADLEPGARLRGRVLVRADGIAAETAKWEQVVKESGAKID